MNLPRVSDTLHEHGVSHTLIAPHVIRIKWLVDGSSQPIVDFDLKHNFIRPSGHFDRLQGREKGKLRSILNSCKHKNIH